MCGCTLYDSPTCGHSWLSMSQPCGYLSDLLSCPNRQTYQTLVAPPYTCPMCNNGFADRETIEMMQGPWGCNQMIRNHVGGNHAIPGQWGNASLPSGGWGGPAITSGAMVSAPAPAPAPAPMNGFAYGHRLTGPHSSHQTVVNATWTNNGPGIGNDAGAFNGGHINERSVHFDHGRNKSRHKSKYKYRYSDKPATNCVVM